MIRSLRWRLVLATAAIIAALAAGAGFLSSVTVKREFERYLVTQRKNELVTAVDALRRGDPPARVHEQFGVRMIIVDDAGRVIARHPADLARFEIELLPNGIKLRSKTERFSLHGNARRINGLGRVFFLPPEDARGEGTFRTSIDQRLVAGLTVAAVLAVAVMLTVFRRVFAPVDALTKGARALADGRLDARVPVRGRDEVGELAAAFNHLAESLERNERARRNMVSDVAHELRTPLTNIRVQVEAVQDGVLTADAAFLHSVEEEVTSLSRLVDDLQQLSLAEAGVLRLDRSEVQIADLIERAVSGIAIPVTREVEDFTVHVDPHRIVQVLRNLLVNASTFAQSSIHVVSRTAGVPPAEHAASRRGSETLPAQPAGTPAVRWIEIRVSDDGPGVPPEHRDRIFDRFHRADASRSRTTGGAGLGLAIAKELVELHGGTIRLEGANTFVFTLPSR